MARVRVVTDSAADLPLAIAAEHGITVIPLSVRFGADEIADTTTLPSAEFWSRCAASPTLPQTSAPAPGMFQQAFVAAADDGCDGVVCISLSGALSATQQSAAAGAEAVADRIAVRAIDSRSVTMGQGLLALEAARLAASGAPVDEVASAIETLVPRTQVFGVLDTLEHLEKGGRIGGARALLGSLLSIKPVVAVVDGAVEEESKQRTRARSLRYLADKARAAGPLRAVAVCNGAASDIDTFLELLDDVQSERPRLVVDLGPVVGAHTGPGTIGLCLLPAG